AGRLDVPASGAAEYILEFTSDRDEQGDTPPARTRFSVRRVDVEHEAPTSDLAALQQLARLTAEHGGRYRSISGLPTTLVELAARDPRQPVATTLRMDPAAQRPWALLLALVAALAAEWAIRRRHGLP
ncbi:MAG: hypothetical protein JXO22_04985, partial [Phycisphaerae bacterium]|nr:hypothetical protein [Phycisphaerae bacterium]